MKYLCFIALLAATVSYAGPLDDKGPPYFVDRYGPPKSSTNDKATSYAHIKRGIVSVPGQFSTRHFKDGDLTVEAVFFLPSLRLATARYRLPHRWTEDQVDAALRAYGGEWNRTKQGALVTRWEAPDGTTAAYILNTLFIHSKELVTMGEKVLEAEEAKRKAMPRF
ncbi:MAG TPA: hypothetical protein VIM71_03030 [Lacunisphaera sp.]